MKMLAKENYEDRLSFFTIKKVVFIFATYKLCHENPNIVFQPKIKLLKMFKF